MAIDITEPIAQWLLDYTPTQLRRERKAYQHRIDLARTVDKKIHDNINSITPGPFWFDTFESMLVRSTLASSKYRDQQVVDWIEARLKELKKK